MASRGLAQTKLRLEAVHASACNQSRAVRRAAVGKTSLVSSYSLLLYPLAFCCGPSLSQRNERLHVDGRHQLLLLLTRHPPHLTLRPSITPQNASAMAETSIKSRTALFDRIAALNLEEVHTPLPGAKPTYTYDASTVKKKPPPPPPSSRPPAYSRQTVNNPPVLSNAPTSTRELGNQPIIANESDKPKVSPALPPRPPPRNASTPRQTPALPPRKASESSVRRRESSESISTIASGISTLSLGSVKTNGTSHSNGSTGTLYQVRAPAYDPSKLPPLPAKKGPENSKQSKATLNAMKSKRDYVPAQALPPQLKTPSK